MVDMSEMLKEERLGLNSCRLGPGTHGLGFPERTTLTKGNRVVRSPMGWIRGLGTPVDSSKNKASWYSWVFKYIWKL